MYTNGYPVLMVEYERGWGSKPDGYLIFKSAAIRDAYIAKEYAGRSSAGAAPDYYVNYNVKPTIQLLPESVHKFNAEGYFYVDKLIQSA